MIGKLAATFGKKIQTAVKSRKKITESGDLRTAYFRKLLYILGEIFFLDIQGAVRAESRKHDGGKGKIVSDHLVIGKIIDRIIGGAKKFHIRFCDQIPGTHIAGSEHGGCGLPDLLGIIRSQGLFDVEVSEEL